MKTLFKTLACTLIVSVALFSCDTSTNSDNTKPSEMPIMNNKVVSYKFIRPKEGYGEYLGDWNGFITEKDTLKSWFPNIFNKEQEKRECNYFAVYFTTNSALMIYWIFSQDMILYNIVPKETTSCIVLNDIVYHAMLICDDEAGTLKNSIDLGSMQTYAVPEWKCDKDGDVINGPNYEDVFF